MWSSDITYIPMLHGFMYLAAILDWFSRYVLAWQLSNTLDSDFCLLALQQPWRWDGQISREDLVRTLGAGDLITPNGKKSILAAISQCLQSSAA